MPSPSPTSSRSTDSVPHINVVRNIVIEDFASKIVSDDDEELDIVEEGNFTMKMEKDENWTERERDCVQEIILGWGNSSEDAGGCGPNWNLTFGLCNLSQNRRQLPIIARFHVMKNGRRKMKTLDTLREVLEPTERSEEDEPKHEEYRWVELFSPAELDEDQYEDSEYEVKMRDCLDSRGHLTIRLEISILPWCLPMTKKRPHQPDESEDNVGKRIRNIGVNSLAEDMSSMRDKVVSDMTITCQGKSFSVHKNFLSARSDVSASMLAHDTKEANDNNVDIEDANPDTVEIFLSYLYESKLPRLTTEETCSLMMMADKYNVRALADACRMCLLKDPQPCDLVQVAILGHLCKDNELKNAAISEMMGEDVGPLRKLKDWTKLQGYPALALNIA